MFQSKIDNDQLQSLPKLNFESKITVIDTYEMQKIVWDTLSQCSVIGFDTESRVSFKKGVQNDISLLQLSGGGEAFLIRINKTPLSKYVLKLLQSKKIIKIGLAIKDDINQLKTKSTFTAQSFVDLQKIVGQYGIEELGLKKITAIVMGKNLSKAQRLSNWSAVKLTEAQIKYAATDAWVCEMIYNKLIQISDYESK